jgi:O-antigen/teichoic acid export membrane protein
VGVVRGGLSARHQFGGLALALVAENGLRCVLAGVLIAAGVTAPLGYGLCLAAGPLVGFLWPSAVRFARDQGTPAAESALRFLGGASGGQLVGQAVLTGGPVVLALVGGTAAQVTSLFAALALFRAPYTVAIALVAKLTGFLTMVYIRGTPADVRRVRLTLVVATVVAVPAAGLIGAAAGPELVPLIFGHDVQFSAYLCALVATGSAFALANLVLTIMLMAQGRTGAIVRGWLVGVVAGGLVLAYSGDDALTRTSWAFLVAEGVAFAALSLEELRGSAGTGRTLPPAAEPNRANS